MQWTDEHGARLTAELASWFERVKGSPLDEQLLDGAVEVIQRWREQERLSCTEPACPRCMGPIEFRPRGDPLIRTVVVDIWCPRCDAAPEVMR
jgi:hypothetical protein